jgi:hypothetical protein
MIVAAAAVSSAVWQWCTQLMAPWIPMGLEESMIAGLVVWTLVLLLLTPTDDHRTLGTLAAIPLPARRLQIQIMGQWQLILSHNLLVFRLGGIVVGSFILPAWHGTFYMRVRR